MPRSSGGGRVHSFSLPKGTWGLCLRSCPRSVLIGLTTLHLFLEWIGFASPPMTLVEIASLCLSLGWRNMVVVYAVDVVLSVFFFNFYTN